MNQEEFYKQLRILMKEWPYTFKLRIPDVYCGPLEQNGAIGFFGKDGEFVFALPYQHLSHDYKAELGMVKEVMGSALRQYGEGIKNEVG